MDLFLAAAVGGLVMGLVYALVALGLGLIWGVMDVINFAHAEYMMLAMYAMFFANRWLALSPPAALVVIVPLAFLGGAATYQVLIRRIVQAPPVTQIFTTFGLLFFLRYLAFAVFGPNYRGIAWPAASGIVVIAGVPVGGEKAAAALAALLTYALLHTWLQHTKTGKALQATA